MRSLALHKLALQHQSLGSLRQALALAEPDGWIRLFVELGPPMTKLLHRLGPDLVARDYAQRILKNLAWSDGVNRTGSRRGDAGPLSHSVSTGTAPNELTNRELEILGMLAQHMQNKEIATKLFISPHTVNYHLKHIYQKHGVTSRRQAVARAVEAGLLKRRP